MNPVCITGRSRIVALIGDPVAHSVSPLLHNHLFANYNLSLVYVPLRTSSVRLRDAITVLRDSGFAGANITIPHKQPVLKLCDEVSPLSQKTGTVNTLYWKNNTLCGTTTDAQGFFAALAPMNIDISNKTVMIVGNGGTARTLAYAFGLEKRCGKLVLAGRSRNKVEPLAREVADITGFDCSAVQISESAFARELSASALLINCTPAGMHPDVTGSPFDLTLLNSHTAVFDTIYNPAKTMLIKAAKALGAPAQNGLQMLICQGLASFALWTGITVDPLLINTLELQAATGSSL